MKTSEKIFAAVSVGTLALSAFSTYYAIKSKAPAVTMNGYMGEILDPNSEGVVVEDSAISKVSDLSNTYFNKAYSTFDTVANSETVQSELRELGLDVYVKNISSERAKSILAAYGAFMVLASMKNNLVKVGLLGGGLYIASKNRQNIQDAYSSLIS